MPVLPAPVLPVPVLPVLVLPVLPVLPVRRQPEPELRGSRPREPAPGRSTGSALPGLSGPPGRAIEDRGRPASGRT